MITATRKPDLAQDWERTRADYDAMRSSPFVRTRLGLAPSGGPADYHIKNEREYLDFIEKARDMCRNDTIIGKTIAKAAANCIQGGFTLCPSTGDKGLDKDLYERWQDWSQDADQCDIQGEATWHEMETIAVQSELRDGDIFAMIVPDGQVQMLEGHLIRNPYGYKRDSINSVIGVELNKYRKATAYHVRQEVRNPYQTTQSSNKSKRYPVRDEQNRRQIMHFHVRDRVSATRGVSCLAPVFQIGGMFDDINFAKVVQAQVVSCFAIMRYQEAGPNGLPAIGTDYGNPSTEAVTGRLLDEIKPGMEFRAAPGERVEGFSPNVPNSEFFQHAKLLLTLIGINIGVPYVEMMLDASETNYSGWRGAVDAARRNWRQTQIALRERWHEPVYRFKVAQWAADDPILQAAQNRSGVNIYRHAWRPPAWPYIQPLDDAAAQAFRQRNGLTSPRRVQNELQQTWDEITTEMVEDNGDAIWKAQVKAFRLNRATERLNEKLSDPAAKLSYVQWRECLAMPTPDGMTLTMPVGQPQQQTQATKQGADNAD